MALPLAALVVSGAAGLVDEVAWSRAMAALFGSALTATGLLLGLFMAGLGVGSAMGARLAARTKRPLAWFGAAEVGIGLLVLASIPAFRAASPFVARWDVRLPDALAPLVPAAVSFVVLGPVTLLMGATFPLFVAAAERRMARGERVVPVVYGVNTLGAVIGTLAGGLMLLPALGIGTSLMVAGVADLVVGAAMIALGWREAGDREPSSDGPNEEPTGDAGARTLALRTAFLGGAAALVLEVAWFRALMLVFGSSVYALSLMLAAFLLGLAGGSMRLAPRGDGDPRPALARWHLLVAFTATIATFLVQVVPAGFIALLKGSGGAFAPVAAGSFVLLALLLLVPTTLMGAALPTAIRLVRGGDVGRVYAASSIGSAAGALAAGFLLVPLLGLRGGVAVAVAMSLLAAALALRAAGDRQARTQALQVGTLVAAIWGAWFAGWIPWNWQLLTGGYYAYAHLYSGDRPPAPGPTRREVRLADETPFLAAPPPVRVDPAAAASGEARLVSWEEGRLAQVAVVDSGAIRSLLVNGKADASNGAGDMRTQLLLGHLPVLLAPDPPAGRAMVVGLGSAVTAGAVASWPFSGIVAAEIEPAVARAARLFSKENGAVLDDPRLELRLDDGRRILDRASDRIALLTSEPSNLWMSGVSLLFTREFFALAADRLGERGVLCQWLHLYQAGEDDVRTLVATLRSAFPHVVAFADGTDLLLVASRAPLTLDPERWRQRLAASPAAADALARAGIVSPRDLAEGILADERGLARWSDGATLHTDDRPILEFTAARRMGSDLSGPILTRLVSAAVDAGPVPLGPAGEVAGPRR